MPGSILTNVSPSSGTVFGPGASSGMGSTMSRADDLKNREMNLRTEYSEPQRFPDPSGGSTTRAMELRAEGVANPYAALPARYDEDNALKERMYLEQATRQAIDKENQDAEGAGGASNTVRRTAPVTDTEYQFTADQQKRKQQYELDQYITTMFDPRMPGSFDVLNKIAPDYVLRRTQQMNTDMQFALRNQLIDSWGINNYDDLIFKYMVDQGVISGPYLNEPSDYNDTNDFGKGILSFSSGKKDQPTNRSNYPYASATIGGTGPKKPMPLNAVSSSDFKNFTERLFIGNTSTVNRDTVEDKNKDLKTNARRKVRAIKDARST